MTSSGDYDQALRLWLGRRLPTSYGARANAEQALRRVQRDRADREAAARALSALTPREHSGASRG